ncbi:hypothetical protein P7D22_18230, partial [Lichenihabitans sp. Uapishka_5]|uniref:hypothetical protein n=1 Tax=Lichenihabitans sp. Uapishka_5 TaxID=3037302 RepID=UPI0029E7D666
TRTSPASCESSVRVSALGADGRIPADGQFDPSLIEVCDQRVEVPLTAWPRDYAGFIMALMESGENKWESGRMMRMRMRMRVAEVEVYGHMLSCRNV